MIGSGGGKASAAASFAESGAAGCCGATDGGSGKTLGADAGAACTEAAAGAAGAADGAGEIAAVEATWIFGAALLPALSRIRSPLPSSVALASVTAGAA